MTAARTFAVWCLLSLGGVSSACGKTADADEAAAPSNPASSKDEPAGAAPDRVVVYYFHGTRRCPTCLGIQKVIEETIEEKFAKALEADLLAFEELNFEEEENKHFVEEYQLAFSTMIVTARAGEKVVKWENAGKIWDYAHAHDDLRAYVEKSVRAYLKLIGAG